MPAADLAAIVVAGFSIRGRATAGAPALDSPLLQSTLRTSDRVERHMYSPRTVRAGWAGSWSVVPFIIVSCLRPVPAHSQTTANSTTGARTGAHRQLSLSSGLTISESSVGGKSIADFAVSPDGLIVINDGDLHLVVFSAAGAKLRSMGRSGEGPGEFRRISELGWLHDTLVVYDATLKRLSKFQVQTGRLLGSYPWAAADPPWAFVNSGLRLYAIVASRTSNRRARPLQPGVMLPVVEYSVVPITGQAVGAPFPQLHDSLDQEAGFDCEKPDGSVEITSFFPDHGNMRTILPGPRLVTASRDDFSLTVRDPNPGRSSTTFHIPRLLLPVPNVLWDSLTRPYRDRTGALFCGRTEQRPAHLPTVRALQADEHGRLWVEVTESAGTSVDILSSTGRSLGTFRMPPHDEDVRWVGRGGLLYVRWSDADGNQFLQVFRVAF